MNDVATIKSAQVASSVEGYAKTTAQMRLMLALSGLFIFALNPLTFAGPDVQRYGALTLYLAFAYCIYAALHYIFIIMTLKVIPLRLVHWVDIGWLVVLISPSGGLESPFFPFFFFPILIASFHYGFAEGVRVTVACTLFSIGIHFFPLPSDVKNPTFPSLIHATALLILGCFIARWGGLEVIKKRQLKLLSEINSMPDPQLGTEQVIGVTLEKIREFYAAQSCIAVMKMQDASYVIYKVERDPSRHMVLSQALEKPIANRLLALPLQYSPSYSSNAEWFLSSTTMYESRETFGKKKPKYGEAVAQLLEAESFVSVPLLLQGQNMGRLYLVASSESLSAEDISFLKQLANQFTPHIENIHLLNQVAVAATKGMGQRISLDLHDGTIQPYIGLKLGLEALRRKMPAGDAITNEVDDLINMTAEGITELRAYIGGLKTRLDGPLLPAIRHMAEKYQQSYGVKVDLNADTTLKISDRLAAEIYQIVREAMSNIRRHTSAAEVSINLFCSDEALTLQIVNQGDKYQDFKIFQPRSITERTTHLGGTVKVSRDADGNTVVAVVIPL